MYSYGNSLKGLRFSVHASAPSPVLEYHHSNKNSKHYMSNSDTYNFSQRFASRLYSESSNQDLLVFQSNYFTRNIINQFSNVVDIILYITSIYRSKK